MRINKMLLGFTVSIFGIALVVYGLEKADATALHNFSDTITTYTLGCNATGYGLRINGNDVYIRPSVNNYSETYWDGQFYGCNIYLFSYTNLGVPTPDNSRGKLALNGKYYCVYKVNNTYREMISVAPDYRCPDEYVYNNHFAWGNWTSYLQDYGALDGGGNDNASVSCATTPSYTNATFTKGTPTSANQSWIQAETGTGCFYSCNVGWSGTDCSIEGTCFDQVQNYNETGVDTGGRCGNVTCGMQEINAKYPVWTIDTLSGSKSDYIINKIGSSTGSIYGYQEDWKYNANAYDGFSLAMQGVWFDTFSQVQSPPMYDFSAMYGTGGGLELKSQGYIQSPVDYASMGQKYGISGNVETSLILSSDWPLETLVVYGTGATEGSGSATISASIINGDVDAFQCLKLYNKDSALIRPTIWKQERDGTSSLYSDSAECIPVSNNTGTGAIYRAVFTGLLTSNTLQIGLPTGANDKLYIINDIRAGRLADQFDLVYLCIDNETGSGIIDGSIEVGSGALGELTGSGDRARALIASGATSPIVGDVLWSFGNLPSVSSGADCSMSAMYSSGAFLYASAGGKLSTKSINNFRITPESWSCELTGWDICKVAYNSINESIGMLFISRTSGVDAILSPVNNALKYIGTPETGKNYCFAGKNLYLPPRVSSYKDTKGVTHSLGANELTTLDMLALSILSALVVYSLIKFFEG